MLGVSCVLCDSRADGPWRLVAAEPALGGERGSLPQALGIMGDGASWVPLVVVGPSASSCSSRWL